VPSSTRKPDGAVLPYGSRMGERINFITCPDPWCGEAALIHGRGVLAECRGDGPVSNMERQGHLRGTPVFRCGKCAALFFVRFSFFGRRAESVAIDEDTQNAMRDAWVDAEFDRMERMEALRAAEEPRS
jgi:hypothetical protein